MKTLLKCRKALRCAGRADKAQIRFAQLVLLKAGDKLAQAVADGDTAFHIRRQGQKIRNVISHFLYLPFHLMLSYLYIHAGSENVTVFLKKGEEKMIHEFPGKPVRQKPSFETVYEENYQAIVRYLHRHTGNAQDAEDLASETFLYCYRTYDNYDPEKSSVSTWLYLAAGSRLKNYYRDRREHVELSELEERLFTEETDMERAAWLEQLRRVLAEKLGALNEKQQRVIVMRFFQEKSFDEIAAAIGSTPGNARVMLSRALDKLEKDFSAIKDDWRI